MLCLPGAINSPDAMTGCGCHVPRGESGGWGRRSGYLAGVGERTDVWPDAFLRHAGNERRMYISAAAVDFASITFNLAGRGRYFYRDGYG